MRTEDEGLTPGEEKLIPEWSVDADDQIVALGLLVLGVFLALFGWNTFVGGDDDGATEDPTGIAADAGEQIAGPLVGGGAFTAGSDTDDAEAAAAAPTTAAPTTAAPTTDAPTTTAVPTTAAPATAAPTTEALDLQPDVDAAIVDFASAAASVDGSAVTLTGFVGTDADKTTAGEAAAAVEGVTTVDNQLSVLEPDVVAALTDNGVTNAGVTMDDTIATLTGEILDETARTAAVDAAAAVPGVTAVVDQLTVAEPAVVTQLNDLFELEPIQFATNSAEILPASFGTLDAAAAILSENSAAIEIQGYTDNRGAEVTNLTLSQARADAVLAYLVSKDVDGSNLQATGYGETTQFGEGDSPDALAANRRVRFELI